MRHRLIAVFFVLSFVASRSARAQVLDQAQLGDYGGAFAPLQYWQGQTFTPDSNTSVGAGFEVSSRYGYPPSFSGDLTIDLWTGPPNSGTFLAGGTTSFSIEDYGWVDVFWNAVTLTRGTSYFLAVHADNIVGYVQTLLGFIPAYAGGGAFVNYSGPETGSYTDFSGEYYYDLTFREWASVTTTPEPATVALLATGLVGIAGFTRRRRKPSA